MKPIAVLARDDLPTRRHRRPSAIAPLDPLVGALLDGRYRVERPIGRGGMARVYEAVDEQEGRVVAVKVLDATPDASARARFGREARVAAAFSHPNAVATLDHGEAPDGLAWLVMDLCPGRPLSDALRGGPLPPARAVRVVAQVLDALQAAHARGIVHRDVKAANVMLDEGGRARVLDFGLAKAFEACASPDLGSVTRTGDVVGSPMVMSPEQCLGEPCDARTDIYSAGVLLYQLLTGRPPFSAPETHRLMLQHVTEPPPGLREVAPGCEAPPALEAAVLRALEKDPDERWPSAAAFREAIEAALGISRAPPPCGARVRVTMACGVARTLVSLGRSGDEWLVRLEDGRVARLDPALLDLTTLTPAGRVGSVIAPGDEVVVALGAGEVAGVVVAAPVAPGAPLLLRRADGGEARVARADARGVDLALRTPALRPGDRFVVRDRAGGRHTGRAAWLADGRVGVDLAGGGVATLALSRLDPSTLVVLVAVPLEAVWAA